MSDRYFVQPIDKLYGPVIRYGTIYTCKTKAKKALAKAVRKSRAAAKVGGYKQTWTFWDTDRESCEINLGPDKRHSPRWEYLTISTCIPGIPYDEVI